MHDGFFVLLIFIALLFDYTNGFHDCANAIATVVYTRALSPRLALLMASFLNVAGALISTRVAATVGKGIVPPDVVSAKAILAALLGAIVWNLLTWYFELPSSSSHALIGGIIGIGFFQAGVRSVNWGNVLFKVLFPAVWSVLLGFTGAFLLTLCFTRLFFHRHASRANHVFRRLQIGSAATVAFAHGTSDAQKTMGIITMALVSGGVLRDFSVPVWVIIACALAMGLGTAAGGWRIIKTMGRRVIRISPVQGFSAETCAAGSLLLAAHFGMPVSTTHNIASAIMGAGASRRLSAVRWGVAHKIIWAWILTIPAAALLAGFFSLFLH